MRWLVIAVALGACSGPTQNQLAETPSARAPRRPSEAPAASSDDKDRERLIQQFDDMETSQRAHAEARQRAAPPPALGSAQPSAGSGQGSAQGSGQGSGQPPPKRKGPAVQGSLKK